MIKKELIDYIRSASRKELKALIESARLELSSRDLDETDNVSLVTRIARTDIDSHLKNWDGRNNPPKLCSNTIDAGRQFTISPEFKQLVEAEFAGEITKTITILEVGWSDENMPLTFRAKSHFTRYERGSCQIGTFQIKDAKKFFHNVAQLEGGKEVMTTKEKVVKPKRKANPNKKQNKRSNGQSAAEILAMLGL